MVIVTELLMGGTLRRYLLNLRPSCLDMRVAVGFALDIARAMECLHSHGIIHRDLKPGTVILLSWLEFLLFVQLLLTHKRKEQNILLAGSVSFLY